jgi:hypothetical protein
MSNESHLPTSKSKSLPASIDRLGFTFLGAGIVLVIAAFALQPVRASFDSVILYLFMVGIAVGAIFLIALEYITGSVWSVPMRRVTEFLAGLSPFLIILVLPMFLHMHDLFHWMHPGEVKADEILAGKSAYLNPAFFTLRTAGFLAIWITFAMLFIRNSTKQDVTRDASLTRASVKLAAVFLPLFAITLTFTAIDWAMSLEAHWFSTIYGVYFFSGSILAALAATTLIVVLMHENGYLPELRRDHFYSLGALMFGFVNFWAYIAFSQFLLVWYANLPEETYWFSARWANGWQIVSVLLIVVQFVVPYIILLPQESKMNLRKLKIMAIVLLVARLIDLFWLVMPTHSPTLSLSWVELGFPLVGIGTVMLLVSWKSKRYNLVPIGDPKLQRGLDFHL